MKIKNINLKSPRKLGLGAPSRLLIGVVPGEVDHRRWVPGEQPGHHRHSWGWRRRSLWRLLGRCLRRSLGLGIAPGPSSPEWDARDAAAPRRHSPRAGLSRWWWWWGAAAAGRVAAACGRQGGQLRIEVLPVPELSELALLDGPSEGHLLR
jgi:hypothetical protein